MLSELCLFALVNLHLRVRKANQNFKFIFCFHTRAILGVLKCDCSNKVCVLQCLNILYCDRHIRITENASWCLIFQITLWFLHKGKTSKGKMRNQNFGIRINTEAEDKDKRSKRNSVTSWEHFLRGADVVRTGFESMLQGSQ